MSELPAIGEAKSSQFLIISIISLSEEKQKVLEAAIYDTLSSKTFPDSEKNVIKQPSFIYNDTKLPNIKEYSRAYWQALRSQSRGGRVYDLAQNAKALGWKELAIFDDLSLRQLERRTNDGEEESLSLVLVAFRQRIYETDKPETNDLTHTIAARRDISEAVLKLVSNSPKIGINCLVEEQLDYVANWYKRGIILRNADRPIFVSETELSPKCEIRSSTIAKALNQSPTLPIEIQYEIETLLDNDLPVENMTLAPMELNWKPSQIEIFVLAPQSENEFQILEESVEAAAREIDPNISCMLYQWNYSEPATRRDICRLWNHLLEHNQAPYHAIMLNFLYPDVWKTHQRLGWLQNCHVRLPDVVREITISETVAQWKRLPADCRVKDIRCHREIEEPDEQDEEEILISPDQPFCSPLPVWMHPSDYGISVPVIFLTRHFNDDQLAALKAVLIAGEGPPEEEFDPLVFIPWEGEKDGTEEDIWQILREICVWKGGRADVLRSIGEQSIVSIDQQSFVDMTVGLAQICRYMELPEQRERSPSGDVDSTEDHKIVGIKYGRIEGAKVRLACACLSIGHRHLFELVGEENEKFYLPPEGAQIPDRF